MNARRIATVLLAAGAVLIGCDRAPQPSPVPDAAASPAELPTGPRSTFIPTPGELERAKAEGTVALARRISAFDYLLHYRLMQATGLEKELGGEEKAVEKLKQLGEEYERRMRVSEVEIPRMIKTTAFTGEGITAGFMGMGMGTFLGMITGGASSGIVGQMSDAQLAELHDRGGFKMDGAGGKAQMQFEKDGSMSTSMEFDARIEGLAGKVKMKTSMTACPDADGKVTVDIDVDSQMSAVDKPGTGGYVHSTFKYERYVDEDAHLIDTKDGSASNHHIRMGGFENFERQYADITLGVERGGKEFFQNHEEGGFSIFRMDEVARMQKMAQAIDLLQTLTAEMMLRGTLSASSSPWESGRCIDLRVTSSPGERSHLKPNTAFDIEAKPRVKSDGSEARGTVTATLTGGSRLQPAGVKVKADAKFAYTGPAEKNETASIVFESRSKRGVGKATLDFDTKAGAYYFMEGGAKELHFSGKVCSLEETFFLSSDGPLNDVEIRFEPASADHGRYSYSGKMTGYDSGEKFTFPVHGKGTYQVRFDGDVAKTILAEGPGVVETPYGAQRGQGKESYTLTRRDDGDCASNAEVGSKKTM